VIANRFGWKTKTIKEQCHCCIMVS
jgi:hypothetical protein